MWRLLAVGIALVVVAGCGSATSDPSTTDSAVPAPGTAAARSTTSAPTSVAPSTSSEATVATTTATSTTMAVIEHELVVIAPGDGVYCNEQPLGQWVHGDVSSEAVVTVHGVHAHVSYVGDTVFGPQMWRWHLRDDIVLDVGLNEVVFEAMFADGSTLRETRTYQFDPSLERFTGYIVELTLAIPPRATLELATLEYGEFGIEQTSEDTEIITDIPIAGDAVFVVIGGPNIAQDQVLDLEEFAQLAATAAREEPLQDLWWDIIFPPTTQDLWIKAAPWEFLLTPDGRLQQAAQLYSP